MRRDTSTERPAQLPTWITAGTALLGAFFAYFAMAVGLLVLAILFRPGRLLSGSLGAIVLLIFASVATGGGLRVVARRFRSPRIQAAALVGTGIMIAVFVLGVLFDTSSSVGVVIFTVLVGAGALIAVFPLTENPSRDPDEPTGVATLRRSLLDAKRRVLGDETVRSDRPSEPPAGSTESTAESTESTAEGTESESRLLDDWHEPLPVSRYWAVVGGAFLLFLPLALVKPELGVGLLSAFLTAYALSHQIEPEATDGGGGGQNE